MTIALNTESERTLPTRYFFVCLPAQISRIESPAFISSSAFVPGDNITKENKIETLVTAKGINNCIAIINDDGTKVDIIVDVKDLNDTVILQIKDIATSQMNCSFEDVTIIQSK